MTKAILKMRKNELRAKRIIAEWRILELRRGFHFHGVTEWRKAKLKKRKTGGASKHEEDAFQKKGGTSTIHEERTVRKKGQNE